MTEIDDWQAKWHGLQDILGPKWTLHILRLLSDGPRGFNDIQRELDGLTAPMLSQRLKELRCHGLVERAVADTTPPTTTYSLSEHGSQIAARLRELESLVELRDYEPEAADEKCSAMPRECRDEALPNRCVTVSNHC